MTAAATANDAYGPEVPQSDKGLDWTNQILEGLGTAHVDWAPKGKIGDALGRFKRASELFHNSRRLRSTISFSGITTVVSSAMRREDSSPCELCLYEYFLSRVLLVHGPQRSALARAEILLYHPSLPDPMPMLQLAREALNSM